jgi:hypothetical protein
MCENQNPAHCKFKIHGKHDGKKCLHFCCSHKQRNPQTLHETHTHGPSPITSTVAAVFPQSPRKQNGDIAKHPGLKKDFILPYKLRGGKAAAAAAAMVLFLVVDYTQNNTVELQEGGERRIRSKTTHM